ncbi:MAG: helix-turn-helix transcriptional regulator [Deltaproteobacteria bacterium]|nr:helix-turn-helix transcriptional regulator [Deltaproteobacteria bacterium]MBW1933161.1 helix-turn-helix transcriptional regulator [Deltaproteobacteria bacterium]MBW1979456.1 helix-turn-helix transcriptional regulator [Deltaproteobacteria bacterium]
MDKKKLSRRERERLRHRQEILDTALRLFSEKGYHNVSMHEIANSAEFGIGTLYKFFKNKEDLYKHLALEQASKFHEALLSAIEEGEDEVEKPRNYVRVKGEVFKDNGIGAEATALMPARENRVTCSALRWMRSGDRSFRSRCITSVGLAV